MVETTYRDALRQALLDEMTSNPDVIIMGEEVGRYGGAYGVTKDLISQFGSERVIDTPISEAAIVGAAVGAAMAGLRPVAELMYVDFIGMTMDQLANQAAKIRYMFGGQIGVPMVLRQAMRQPDPVVFIEHKGLYTMKGELDVEAEADPWGQAKIMREGDDLVIVSYSRQLHYALAAAETLAKSGVQACVIDLRTLNPLDFETIRPQVERAGRAMVVAESVMTCGVAAELASRISEECFDFLEDPVIRVAGEDIPISVSPLLEKNSVPTPQLIVDAAKMMLA